VFGNRISLRWPRKFYSPQPHLYCGKSRYFVHFWGVFGNFACGIQGKALEQPHYFRQPDDNAALNCGSVVRKKWLSEAQKGQVGPTLSVLPCLRGDYAAVQSVLPQRWHWQWDVIGFRAHTHARFAGVWRRCAY